MPLVNGFVNLSPAYRLIPDPSRHLSETTLPAQRRPDRGRRQVIDGVNVRPERPRESIVGCDQGRSCVSRAASTSACRRFRKTPRWILPLGVASCVPVSPFHVVAGLGTKRPRAGSRPLASPGSVRRPRPPGLRGRTAPRTSRVRVSSLPLGPARCG